MTGTRQSISKYSEPDETRCFSWEEDSEGRLIDPRAAGFEQELERLRREE